MLRLFFSAAQSLFVDICKKKNIYDSGELRPLLHCSDISIPFILRHLPATRAFTNRLTGQFGKTVFHYYFPIFACCRRVVKYLVPSIRGSTFDTSHPVGWLMIFFPTRDPIFVIC